jgi:hypothetical protein
MDGSIFLQNVTQLLSNNTIITYKKITPSKATAERISDPK